MCIGCALEVCIWLSNKVFCNIHIGYTLNYFNSRCNTAKLLWVVICVVCYGWFSPDLVVMNICRQRLNKVDRLLWQRSLANENAVVCQQGAMRWRVILSELCVYLSDSVHDEGPSYNGTTHQVLWHIGMKRETIPQNSSSVHQYIGFTCKLYSSEGKYEFVVFNTYTAMPVCWREWISWQLL